MPEMEVSINGGLHQWRSPSMEVPQFANLGYHQYFVSKNPRTATCHYFRFLSHKKLYLSPMAWHLRRPTPSATSAWRLPTSSPEPCEIARQELLGQRTIKHHHSSWAPSGNQTCQLNMDNLKGFFLVTPPFIGDSPLPCLITRG